jgi:hypothetical protein
MTISVRGNGNQFVVEIAADERHEGFASCVNAANRQPSRDLGYLWAIVGKYLKVQLARGFDGEAGMIFSESRRFRLAAAIDAEQDHRRWV